MNDCWTHHFFVSARLHVYSVDLEDNREARKSAERESGKDDKKAQFGQTAAGASGWKLI